MNVGDMVRFINASHTSYHRLRSKSGLVLEIDHRAAYCRPYNTRHLGAKVTVVFDNEKPAAYTEYSLEVINENR